MAKKDIIAEAKTAFAAAKDRYSDFFERVVEDYEFRAGNQWPDEIKHMRENDPEGARPCLVMDKTNQYVRQVVNDARQNRPAIRVRPVDSGADKETAEILQGIIRHIEDQSRADIAYESALDAAVTCGLGWIRCTTILIDEATNQQEIRIDRLPNTCAVYPDVDWADPDGADLQRVFVVERFSKDEFKRKFPKSKVESWEDDSGEWLTEDSVTIAEDYKVVESTESRFVLEDGQEMTEEQYWSIFSADENRPSFEVRETQHKHIQWRKLTCGEILDETTIPCEWIPVLPVIGNELWIDGKRQLSGMVRTVMDAQRAYNYARSAYIEQVALSPKAPYVAADGQVEDFAAEWASANTRNLSVLRYRPVDNAGHPVPPPQRQMPPQPSSGWLQEMDLAERDIQAALGMYNASIGAPSNEKSGKAIIARQREGDVSTYHYIDNLARTLRQLGKCLISMIPRVYDTQRVVRILGEDGEPDMVRINPQLPVPSMKSRDDKGRMVRLVNPSIGKYDVSVYVGPAYSTKRQEAAEAMVEMTRGNPDLMAVVGDLMVEAMDWPMADRISKRLKAMLPPQIAQAEAEEDEEQAKVQAAVQQVTQQFQMQAQEFQQQAMAAIQELQQKAQQLEAENQALKADKSADMLKLEIDRAKVQDDSRKTGIQAYEAETERIQVMTSAEKPEVEQPDVSQILQPIIDQIAQIRQQIAAPQQPPIVNVTVERGGTVRKEVAITAPSGGVYTGVIEGQE